MTKPTRPFATYENYYLHVRFSVLREGSATGSLTLDLFGVISGFPVWSIADLPADTWTTIEAYVNVTGGDEPRVGFATESLVGSIRLSSLYVDRSRGGPIQWQKAASSAYALSAKDIGGHVYISTGGVTLPQLVVTVGSTCMIVNNSGSSQTITQGASVTLRLAGTTSTGNRTLAAYGVARLINVATDVWLIDGTGVT